MVGRPRKSSSLKQLQGKESLRTVQAKSGRPDCPPDIAADPVAKGLWDWLVATLEPMGILTIADRLVLETLAEDYSELKAAMAQVRKDGLILQGEKGGRYCHPGLNAANSARKRIRSILSELGLTPKAREQLNLQLNEVRASALAAYRAETEASREHQE